MSSLVRFAAMMPATCAVASASPFGSSRRRRAVSGAIRTVACATARRRDIGLSPTSTMRTSPVSLTWLSSPIRSPILTVRPRGDSIQSPGGGAPQPVQLVRAQVLAMLLGPAPPLWGVQFERPADRLGLALHVERVDGESPLTQLSVRA